MAMLKNQRVWVQLFQVSEFIVFTQRNYGPYGWPETRPGQTWRVGIP